MPHLHRSTGVAELPPPKNITYLTSLKNLDNNPHSETLHRSWYGEGRLPPYSHSQGNPLQSDVLLGAVPAFAGAYGQVVSLAETTLLDSANTRSESRGGGVDPRAKETHPPPALNSDLGNLCRL